MSGVNATAIKQDVRWWMSEKADVFRHVTGLVRRIREQQAMRKSMDLHHMRLYGNLEITGFGPDTYWRTPMGYEPSTLAFNVVRSSCDTVASKVSKNRPLPMFLTTGGNYVQQKRARDLGRFIEGEYDRCDVWRLRRRTILDACVFGTGLVTAYRDGNKIRIDRVFPWELIVDAVEAQYGEPRSIYQRRWVDRYKLAEKYPRLASEIESAQHNTDDDREASYEATSDLVLVTEAWRLPNAEGKEGRHVAVINNATLEDEPYKRDYFPFVAWRKADPLMGFWGTGFAQELCGLQYEINFTAMRVQKAHRVMGGSMWLVDSQSEVLSSHLSNDAGVVVKYKGRPPTAFAPQPISPQGYQYLFDLKREALPEVGVSEMSAQSAKPPGITAAIAMETLNDAESERFLTFYKNDEDAMIELARQMIDLGKEISEDDPEYAVRAVGKRKITVVKFADVDLDRDEYVMQVFPTSLLARTPTARLQQITDWVNIGWLTPTEGKMLMDFPDLDRVRQLQTSSYELVEEILERLVDGDPADPETFVAPEPQMDLPEAMKTAQLTYLRAKLDGVPEDNLKLLRDWYMQAKALDDAQKTPAPTMPGPGAMPAGPPPGAPPPSPPPGPMPGNMPMGNA